MSGRFHAPADLLLVKESPVPIKIRGWMGLIEIPDALEEKNVTTAARRSSST
jgi:hypothetical protein